jgi:hypothetical protein
MIRPIVKGDYWEHFLDDEKEEFFLCFVCEQKVESYSRHIKNGAHPGILHDDDFFPSMRKRYIAPFFSVCRVIR